MVLTDEIKVDKYPVATLEDSKLETEKAFYQVDEGQIVAKGSVAGLDQPENTYTNGDNTLGNNPPDASFEAANSTKLYKLNKNTAKMGLGITLKVMAGDRIDIRGKSYYNQSNTDGSSVNGDLAVLDILNGFVGGAGGVVATTAHESVSGTQLNGYTGLTQDINNFKSTQTSDIGNSYRPKAYINYIFFDEQFNYAGGSFDPVATSPGIKNHNLPGIAVPKNGYVYIYCSNESPVNVFFDNVQVVHTRGAMLEETHYYPFGLTMQGISSKAAGTTENKKKYQQYELNSDFDINLYESFYRSHDPQLGRFWQLTPSQQTLKVHIQRWEIIPYEIWILWEIQSLSVT